jgi:hypothetical protein
MMFTHPVEIAIQNTTELTSKRSNRYKLIHSLPTCEDLIESNK